MDKEANKITIDGGLFNTVKVMNYNICRSPKTEGTPFCFGNRVDRIIKVIENHDPDILMLQECRRLADYDKEDSIEPFFARLRKMGYMIEEFRTNGTPLCLVNCICYKRKLFFLKERDIKYMSSTPDVPSPGWGNGFGRSVGRVKLYPLNKDGKIYTNFLFGACVTHFSLPEDAKDCEAMMFHDLLYDDVPTIFSGDFNSFGDHAEHQREIIFGNSSVDDACVDVIGTWLGHDDDFPVKVGEIGEKLDGLAGINGIVWLSDIIVDTHDYIDVSCDDDDAYIDRSSDEDESEHYNCPSDHAPIVASFVMRTPKS